MKAHQNTIGNTDTWITPEWILKPLGEFDLDPCAANIMPWPTAKKSYTEEQDGLIQPWEGRVWLNPPFNRYQRPLWMEKMNKHNNGIMLIPAACETIAFSQYVFGTATGILMVKGRPHFADEKGNYSKLNCGATICLVAYGRENLYSLLQSGLGQTLICI